MRHRWILLLFLVLAVGVGSAQVGLSGPTQATVGEQVTITSSNDVDRWNVVDVEGGTAQIQEQTSDSVTIEITGHERDSSRVIVQAVSEEGNIVASQEITVRPAPPQTDPEAQITGPDAVTDLGSASFEANLSTETVNSSTVSWSISETGTGVLEPNPIQPSTELRPSGRSAELLPLLRSFDPSYVFVSATFEDQSGTEYTAGKYVTIEPQEYPADLAGKMSVEVSSGRSTDYTIFKFDPTSESRSNEIIRYSQTAESFPALIQTTIRGISENVENVQVLTGKRDNITISQGQISDDVATVGLTDAPGSAPNYAEVTLFRRLSDGTIQPNRDIFGLDARNATFNPRDMVDPSTRTIVDSLEDTEFLSRSEFSDVMKNRTPLVYRSPVRERIQIIEWSPYGEVYGQPVDVQPLTDVPVCSESAISLDENGTITGIQNLDAYESCIENGDLSNITFGGQGTFNVSNNTSTLQISDREVDRFGFDSEVYTEIEAVLRYTFSDGTTERVADEQITVRFPGNYTDLSLSDLEAGNAEFITTIKRNGTRVGYQAGGGYGVFYDVLLDRGQLDPNTFRDQVDVSLPFDPTDVSVEFRNILTTQVVDLRPPELNEPFTRTLGGYNQSIQLDGNLDAPDTVNVSQSFEVNGSVTALDDADIGRTYNLSIVAIYRGSEDIRQRTDTLQTLQREFSGQGETKQFSETVDGLRNRTGEVVDLVLIHETPDSPRWVAFDQIFTNPELPDLPTIGGSDFDGTFTQIPDTVTQNTTQEVSVNITPPDGFTGDVQIGVEGVGSGILYNTTTVSISGTENFVLTLDVPADPDVSGEILRLFENSTDERLSIDQEFVGIVENRLGVGLPESGIDIQNGTLAPRLTDDTATLNGTLTATGGPTSGTVATVAILGDTVVSVNNTTSVELLEGESVFYESVFRPPITESFNILLVSTNDGIEKGDDIESTDARLIENFGFLSVVDPFEVPSIGSDISGNIDAPSILRPGSTVTIQNVTLPSSEYSSTQTVQISLNMTRGYSLGNTTVTLDPGVSQDVDIEVTDSEAPSGYYLLSATENLTDGRISTTQVRWDPTDTPVVVTDIDYTETVSPGDTVETTVNLSGESGIDLELQIDGETKTTETSDGNVVTFRHTYDNVTAPSVVNLSIVANQTTIQSVPVLVTTDEQGFGDSVLSLESYDGPGVYQPGEPVNATFSVSAGPNAPSEASYNLSIGFVEGGEIVGQTNSTETPIPPNETRNVGLSQLVPTISDGIYQVVVLSDGEIVGQGEVGQVGTFDTVQPNPQNITGDLTLDERLISDGQISGDVTLENIGDQTETGYVEIVAVNESGTETQISNISIDSLDGTVTRSFSSPISSGTYDIEAREFLDTDGNVVAVDVAQVVTDIPEIPDPRNITADLTLDDRLISNGTISGQVDVENIGNQTETGYVEIVAVNESGVETQIANITAQTLDPGNTVTSDFSSPISPGTYEIEAREFLDTDGNVVAVDVAQVVSGIPEPPRSIVGSLTLDERITTNDTVSGNVTIENIGDEAKTGYVEIVAINESGVETQIENITGQTLDPGSTAQVSYTGQLPDGSYQIEAREFLDTDGTLIGVDVVRVSATVPETPDPQNISGDLALDERLISDGQISGNVTIENIGSQTESGYVEIVAVNESGVETQIGNITGQSLNSGDTVTRSFSSSIPNGTYEIEAREFLDTNGEIIAVDVAQVVSDIPQPPATDTRNITGDLALDERLITDGTASGNLTIENIGNQTESGYVEIVAINESGVETQIENITGQSLTTGSTNTISFSSSISSGTYEIEVREFLDTDGNVISGDVIEVVSNIPEPPDPRNVVGSLTLDERLISDGTISGQVDVENIGNQTETGYVEVVAINGSGVETQIENITGQTLDPGNTVTESFSSSIPNGTYEIELRDFIDTDGEVISVDVAQVVSGIPEVPDARSVVGSITLDERLISNGTISGQVDVENIGDETKNGFVEIVAVNESGTETQIGDVTLESLDPGSTVTSDFSSSISPGTYEIELRDFIDTDGEVISVDVAQVVSGIPEPPEPDTRNITGDLTVDDRLSTDGTVSGNLTIENIGNQTETGFVEIVAIDGSGAETEIAVFTGENLDPGDTVTRPFTSELSAGTYDIEVRDFIDTNGEIIAVDVAQVVDEIPGIPTQTRIIAENVTVQQDSQNLSVETTLRSTTGQTETSGIIIDLLGPDQVTGVGESVTVDSTGVLFTESFNRTKLSDGVYVARVLNNTASRVIGTSDPFIVSDGSPPQLPDSPLIGNIEAPRSAAPGDQVVVNATVTNNDTDTNRTFQVDLVGQDRVVRFGEQTVSLNPGEQTTLEFTSQIPDLDPGIYELRFSEDTGTGLDTIATRGFAVDIELDFTPPDSPVELVELQFPEKVERTGPIQGSVILNGSSYTVDLEVRNAGGTVVRSTQISGDGQITQQIDLPGIDEIGTYQVSLTENRSDATDRFVGGQTFLVTGGFVGTQPSNLSATFDPPTFVYQNGTSNATATWEDTINRETGILISTAEITQVVTSQQTDVTAGDTVTYQISDVGVGTGSVQISLVERQESQWRVVESDVAIVADRRSGFDLPEVSGETAFDESQRLDGEIDMPEFISTDDPLVVNTTVRPTGDDVTSTLRLAFLDEQEQQNVSELSSQQITQERTVQFGFYNDTPDELSSLPTSPGQIPDETGLYTVVLLERPDAQSPWVGVAADTTIVSDSDVALADYIDAENTTVETEVVYEKLVRGIQGGEVVDTTTRQETVRFGEQVNVQVLQESVTGSSLGSQVTWTSELRSLNRVGEELASTPVGQQSWNIDGSSWDRINITIQEVQSVRYVTEINGIEYETRIGTNGTILNPISEIDPINDTTLDRPFANIGDEFNSTIWKTEGVFVERPEGQGEVNQFIMGDDFTHLVSLYPNNVTIENLVSEHTEQYQYPSTGNVTIDVVDGQSIDIRPGGVFSPGPIYVIGDGGGVRLPDTGDAEFETLDNVYYEGTELRIQPFGIVDPDSLPDNVDELDPVTGFFVDPGDEAAFLTIEEVSRESSSEFGQSVAEFTLRGITDQAEIVMHELEPDREYTLYADGEEIADDVSNGDGTVRYQIAGIEDETDLTIITNEDTGQLAEPGTSGASLPSVSVTTPTLILIVVLAILAVAAVYLYRRGRLQTGRIKWK